MAGMRLSALMLSVDDAYYEFAVAPDAYPPRITGVQLCSPLEDVAGPHAGKY